MFQGLKYYYLNKNRLYNKLIELINLFISLIVNSLKINEECWNVIG